MLGAPRKSILKGCLIVQYKAKSDPLKGQSSETSGLNYGIFPDSPHKERKPCTINKNDGKSALFLTKLRYRP